MQNEPKFLKNIHSELGGGRREQLYTSAPLLGTGGKAGGLQPVLCCLAERYNHTKGQGIKTFCMKYASKVTMCHTSMKVDWDLKELGADFSSGEEAGRMASRKTSPINCVAKGKGTFGSRLANLMRWALN